MADVCEEERLCEKAAHGSPLSNSTVQHQPQEGVATARLSTATGGRGHS